MTDRPDPGGIRDAVEHVLSAARQRRRTEAEGLADLHGQAN